MPLRQKEGVLPEDLTAMRETLDRSSLRGSRDRAMLLIGFAGSLRRSEITGLDLGRDQTEDDQSTLGLHRHRFDREAMAFFINAFRKKHSTQMQLI